MQVELPVERNTVLLDIAFTGSDPKHGFLTGTKQTLLETFNGGKTWEPRYIESVDEEGINYRYTSVSFNGDEGWMVGKPGVSTAHPILHPVHFLKILNWDDHTDSRSCMYSDSVSVMAC